MYVHTVKKKEEKNCKIIKIKKSKTKFVISKQIITIITDYSNYYVEVERWFKRFCAPINENYISKIKQLKSI